jgi:hypothetical protein
VILYERAGWLHCLAYPGRACIKRTGSSRLARFGVFEAQAILSPVEFERETGPPLAHRVSTQDLDQASAAKSKTSD